MKQDGRNVDVLVIGAGATGMGVAWDACLRGLSVALVEARDLGQGTSGRYHGLLHSGGRYVISDPHSAADCARENEVLRRIAPAAIEDTGGLFVALPEDPPEFAERWLAACRKIGVPVREISPTKVLEQEPLLSPEIRRAFRVHDAALDSFDLLHALKTNLEARGGHVFLRHRVQAIIQKDGVVEGAEVEDACGGSVFPIEARCVVNAGGPWAGDIAQMAGVSIPLALGKGVMVAMASRLLHTVVNRCKPPGDGDIIVPVGTVMVLGTSDVPVSEPGDRSITPEEVDMLLREGERLIPSLPEHRALRAWAGVRPLYQPESQGDETRELPRAHVILDHAEDGARGFVSVFGGKLSTFRLMAEETMNVIAPMLGCAERCRTADVPLMGTNAAYYTLPDRLRSMEHRKEADESPDLVCECEMVTRAELDSALDRLGCQELDTLRRELRIGMGPCQAGFCGYRTAGIVHAHFDDAPSDGGLAAFLEERWRGNRPVAWGQNLRQMAFSRRVYMEMMRVQALERDVE